MLKGKTIAVCVTGGIAAYKACELVSRLTKKGADVHVVMTESAKHFVSALTFETLSKNKVIFDLFDENREWEVEHIALAKKVSAFVIAPCTANVVGKLACGIADDFLTTTVMAATCPIIICPAMNTNMYNHPAFIQNRTKLEKRGIIFVSAEDGLLACGDIGSGRLASIDVIEDAIIKAVLPTQDFLGKTVLVTAGATSEPIDGVRYITNKSSGKMGLAIAAAARRGASVMVVAGRLSVPIEDIYKVQKVETTKQMYQAVLEKNADYYIMAAAPADYRVENYSEQKIKADSLTLKLIKNPDIARAVGKKIAESGVSSKLIIFCAETQNLLQNAREKLAKKQAHIAVANDVTQAGAGFNCDTNIATIITQNDEYNSGLVTKTALADIILDKALCLPK